MVKYSEGFKLSLVTEYLQGNLGYALLARKYNMPSDTPIKNWVSAYKNQGVRRGLKRKNSREAYPVQFKLDTIHFMLRTGASYQETADQFMLNNPSLIARWMIEFREQGVRRPETKTKGATFYV